MIRPKPKDEDGKIYSGSSGAELVIVKKENKTVYMVFEDKELIDIELENENELPVGTKCVGKVSSLADNINAAYILLPDRNKAFLKDVNSNLKCEQNIAVEIVRASSKGKLPSVKMTDEDISHRSDLSVISYGERCYTRLLRDYKIDRILTDSDKNYEEIYAFCKENNVIDLSNILRYNDSMVSLSVLYSVSQKIKEATSKTVWLKSGANIIIEETSAFTVIDVNSAKNAGSGELSYFDINLEAAKEIFRQMNLRNISGIILVDFINMDHEKTKDLLNELRELSKGQKKSTKVVDITPLGVAEITRKKEGATLSDIFK